MKYITTINDKTFEIDIQKDGTVLVNGQPRHVDFLELGPALYSLLREHISHEVVVEERDGKVQVQMNGRLYSGEVLDERAQLMGMRRGAGDAGSGELVVKSPMPGLIVAVPVVVGQEVRKGQTILILESMKMQNELKAPRDATVQQIHVQPGQSVEQNKPLVTVV